MYLLGRGGEAEGIFISKKVKKSNITINKFSILPLSDCKKRKHIHIHIHTRTRSHTHAHTHAHTHTHKKKHKNPDEGKREL